jgi:hypothetical protein
MQRNQQYKRIRRGAMYTTPQAILGHRDADGWSRILRGRRWLLQIST